MANKEILYSVVSWAVNCPETACSVCSYATDELGADTAWCKKPKDKTCVDGIVEWFLTNKPRRFQKPLTRDELIEARKKYSMDVGHWSIAPIISNALVATVFTEDREPCREQYFDVSDDGFRLAKEWCVSTTAEVRYAGVFD